MMNRSTMNRSMMNRSAASRTAMNLPSLLAAALLAGWITPFPAFGQQVADSTFHPTVAKPAFVTSHPRILFDEAHHNFHTLGGRYRAFGELIERDGCVLTPNGKPFSAATLSGSEILVIANAAGDDLASGTDSSVALPAFTVEEVEALYQWVRDGGRLLLIADHAPFGSAAARLAERFGVSMSAGYTIDSTQALPGEGPGTLEFTRDRGSLGGHAIFRGRSDSERIGRLVAFTGQSLRGPEGSSPLMILSPSALDIPFQTFAKRQDYDAMVRQARPARGRSMGVALEVGRGRIVMLGEAAMLSAQVVVRPGSEPRRFGMNRPGIDNQQFALNVVRWLAGVLN